ncbi:MAG TPA: Ig-like domain-containing protein [Bacilli bacterium]|nr:Ig-like domain-containing protein [Bacilli bacterium]HPS18519.1 Ig-like domain-containing protein [Bacilli bacterium]
MSLSKIRSASLFLGACVLVASTMFVGIAVSQTNNPQPTHAYYNPITTYTNGDGATYYNGISQSATGTTLLSALQTLNKSKRKITMGYSKMGTSASTSPYVYTDYNPNGTTYTDSNGQIYGTSLASFYTKTSMTSYNKEHVWPNSRGGSAVEADIHMPRPTIAAENSNRGNSFYVEGMASSSSGWDPYTAGYSEISRGEAARIIFYCCAASSTLSLSDNTNGSGNLMGKLSDMLKWNLQYSVTTYERNRNEGAEYLQGNRNPFIDHPEYACKIWGNTNSTTQAICASGGTTAPNTITLSPSSSVLAIGGTVNLSVAVDSGSSSVTWSSSNSSVASVSNGVVTGVAGGTATITATSTLNTAIKGTATIMVKSLSSLSVSGTPTTTSYMAGQSFNPAGLTVTATYTDNSTTNITPSVVWTPNPLTAGTTVVTGSFGGKTVTVSGIQVTSNPGDVTGVSLNKESISLSVGKRETLIATVTPADAINKTIGWSTSDPSVAIISEGTVIAVKAGTAIVTVTTQDGHFTASCTIIVKEAIEGGCSGSIAVTSGLIATLSALGAIFIFIRKKKYTNA